jgi:hypothetical protein
MTWRRRPAPFFKRGARLENPQRVTALLGQGHSVSESIRQLEFGYRLTRSQPLKLTEHHKQLCRYSCGLKMSKPEEGAEEN